MCVDGLLERRHVALRIDPVAIDQRLLLAFEELGVVRGAPILHEAPARAFLDVRDQASIESFLADVERRLGAPAILVNSAGISVSQTVSGHSDDDWQAVIDTNLGSCFNCCHAVIDGMRERNFGRIVNIGSINGQAGQYGQVNYAAAKSGIHGFTKALALETASKGITVNAIAPGYIATEMVMAVPKDVLDTKVIPQIPVGRLGQAEEIARCVVFLASDDCPTQTAADIVIDGGLTAGYRQPGVPGYDD